MIKVLPILATLATVMMMTACVDGLQSFRSSDDPCMISGPDGSIQASALGFDAPGCSELIIASDFFTIEVTDGSSFRVGGEVLYPDEDGLIVINALDYDGDTIEPAGDKIPCDPAIMCCAGKIKIPPPAASKVSDTVTAGHDPEQTPSPDD